MGNNFPLHLFKVHVATCLHYKILTPVGTIHVSAPETPHTPMVIRWVKVSD